MGYSYSDIIIATLALVAGLVSGIGFGEIAINERNLKRDKVVALAKCKSMGGVYGGGKCFVNGVELTTDK